MVKRLRYDIRKKNGVKGGNIFFVFVYIYIGWVYIIEIKFLKDLNWFLFENDWVDVFFWNNV